MIFGTQYRIRSILSSVLHSFKNCVIIMTSNVGARNISEPNSLGFTSGSENRETVNKNIQNSVMDELKKMFRPEFLNRLDEMILFKPLTKQDIGGIIHLIIADLNERLSDRELRIELTDEAAGFIVENGYDPVYGARPLKRYIQKYVETLAAKLILRDEVAGGDTILITVKDEELAAVRK